MAERDASSNSSKRPRPPQLARHAADAAQGYADQIADAARRAAHAARAARSTRSSSASPSSCWPIFVGYYVVWSVTPALHTPLMAVTNAISSVIVVGALLAVGVDAGGSAMGRSGRACFGFVALVLASVNIFGGFLVTQRMLAMYKKKG